MFESLWFPWKLARQYRGRRRPPRSPKAHRCGTRLCVEQLEDRTLPSNFFAATTADLIADINAANSAGGTNTITLTAPTGSLYVLTAVDNTTNGTGYGGGIYVSNCVVYIDAFTVANTVNNTDGSGLNGTTANIDGPYSSPPPGGC